MDGSLHKATFGQLIGRKKLERLAKLAQSADISVCVDSAGNVEEMSRVATETGITFHCVVEADVGQARWGNTDTASLYYCI